MCCVNSGFRMFLIKLIGQGNMMHCVLPEKLYTWLILIFFHFLSELRVLLGF